MKTIKGLIGAVDRWQRSNRVAGPGYAMVRKFGEDRANLLVVGLGWYGFLSIYPLLLAVVTVFGYIGKASLGEGIVRTLQQFPVIGDQFKVGPGGSDLHGSVLGLVVGLAGLLYGAQGVTQTAEQMMLLVWDLRPADRPGFVPRLGRSFAALAIIGGTFVINAFGASVAAGSGRSFPTRVALVACLLVVNVGLYLAAFRVLTPRSVATRSLVPGSVLAAVGFTLLITVGTSLVQHQLRHTNATYGAFASVIGVVTFLLLLGKITAYAAELNPVLARRLWPRALPTAEPTEIDARVTRRSDPAERS